MLGSHPSSASNSYCAQWHNIYIYLQNIHLREKVGSTKQYGMIHLCKKNRKEMAKNKNKFIFWYIYL
jgi:hypothetical protein